MVVYADILIAVNIITDYFLLKVTALFLREHPRPLRLLTAAFLGGISSLWIFFESPHFMIELLFRIAVALLLSFVGFGFCYAKRFFRIALIFFGVSCLFLGFLAAIYYIFKPKNMVIYNSVVYFNISAVALVLFSVLGYIAVNLIYAFVKRNGESAKRYILDIYLGDAKKSLTALSDSGNSLSDVFGSSEIFIVEQGVVDIFGVKGDKTRYRAIPISTVSGAALLDGYRFDRAVIHTNGRQKEFINPLLAISKTKINSECDAIINPKAVL